MTTLVEKLLEIHDSLEAASLPHAFGGAIALAYCTEEPRGTRDLDVNIFTDAAQAKAALAALPEPVRVSAKDVKTVQREGQTRLWWDDTPIDVFLNNHPYHEVVSRGVTWVQLAGHTIPVLDCSALIVFKAMFDRTKDWADIEAIAAAVPAAVGTAGDALAGMLGEDEPRVERLASLAG